MHDVASGVIAKSDLWFMELIVGLSVLVVLNYVFKRVVKHVRHRSLSTANSWREKLDYIVFVPVHALLWILGGILILEVLGRHFEVSLLRGYLNSLRATAIIACLVWVLLRWQAEVQHFVLRLDGRAKSVDKAFVQMLGKISTVVIFLVSGLAILHQWGLNIGPLVAFGGIGAAAIGFAGKDVIANFFGGLMLYITRPFVVGDFIVMVAPELAGHVEEIGWYLTSVRDKQKRAVYLPNAIFSNALVVNSSRMTHRKIEEKVGVGYEDAAKVGPLVEEVRRFLLAHPRIDTHVPVLVSLAAFGVYSLDINIEVYTLATGNEEFAKIKQEVLLAICQITQNAGVQLANPVFNIKSLSSGTV